MLDKFKYFQVHYFFTGLGEPTYFYVEVVFWLSGMMMGTLFLYGTFLR